MSSILIELQYLPSLEYFCALLLADDVVIESHEHYEKQSFRNRTNILTANGVSSLSIPIRGGNKKILSSKIEIDYNQKWKNNHWRAIQSAYGKAPYFEFYADYFNRIYKTKPGTLFEFNKELLSICLKLLQLDIKIRYTTVYEKESSEGLIDLRSVIHPKKTNNLNGIYAEMPYLQVFGNEFVPNMSIVDLLFCEGPNACNILEQSALNFLNI